MSLEVDHGGVPIGGDIQILETGDRGEVDRVFPVGEVLDRVVSVIGFFAKVPKRRLKRGVIRSSSTSSPPSTAPRRDQR